MKSKLVKGTLILTFAGLATRILGFFYRIYLSHHLGTANLGLYQLIFPIYAICFTLYASGIQTGVSQLISQRMGTNNKKQLPIVIIRVGIISSLCVACTLSCGLYFFSDAIAMSYFHAPSMGKLLKILSFIFPFCGITSVINGVFYGLGKAGVPAFTQWIEQVVRIAFVFFIVTFLHPATSYMTCIYAVWGLIAGELASNVYNIISFFRAKKDYILINNEKRPYQSLMKLALPLSGTRVIIAILGSLEAVLIPAMLVKYGFSGSTALSYYGILSGMVLPFIFFPGALTNSMSVLLLPTIANAVGSQNQSRIAEVSKVTIKYTFLLGILTMVIFMLFGKELGLLVYHNEQAGLFLVIMSCLCPFLYVSTTLNSIINGLGKSYITFRNTVIGLSIRILFLIAITPQIGIVGYFIGYLLSQILITILDGYYLHRRHPFPLQPIKSLILPGTFLFLFGFCLKKGVQLLTSSLGRNQIALLTLLIIPVLCLVSMAYMKKKSTLCIKDI